MAVCPNCNTVNEDGAGFCTGCGNALTQQESLNQELETVLEEQIPNEILSEQVSDVIEQAQPLEEMPAMPPKKKGGKKWLLFGGIGVVAAAAIAVGAIFLPKLLAKDKKVEQVFYVKDGSLFYRDLDGKESLELSGKVNKEKNATNEPRVVVNAAQTRVFYAEKIEEVQEEPEDEYSYSATYYKYDLCYVDLNKKKAEPQTLASDVRQFEIDAAGKKVVYQTEDGTLYIHDLKEEEKIEKNVSGFYANKDLSRIGYQKEDDLYLWENGEAEKITSGVDYMQYVDEELTYVLYEKEETLYVHELGKDAVKVAENVYNVYSVEDMAFYYTATAEGGSIMDYVEDDMKDADAKLTEPVWPEREEYPEYPSRPSAYDFGDDEDAYQAAVEQYEKDKEAYDAEVERIDEAFDAAVEQYNQDQEAYSAKQQRDYIREELETYEFNDSMYALYYFDGKESTKITDTMANGWYEERAYDADVLVIAVTSAEMEKVKLSEVEYTWEIEDQIRQAKEASKSYAVVSGKTMTKLECEDVYSLTVANDGSAIWYVSDVKTETIDVGEGNGPDKETAPTGNLYKVALKDGKPGKAEKYDEKVYASDISTGVDGAIAYYKDVEMEQESEYYSYGVGTLYIDKTEVAKDIRCGYAAYSEELKAWSILSDMDEENETYTISFYSDGKLTEVAEDIAGAAMTPGGDFVYIADWDAKDECGTLYSYNNGKPVEIDEEVQAVLHVQFMEK